MHRRDALPLVLALASLGLYVLGVLMAALAGVLLLLDLFGRKQPAG